MNKIEIINKTASNINGVLFVSKVNRWILNMIILLLIVVLEKSDITMKVSANYFTVIWISINSFYAMSLVLQSHISFIYHINSISNSDKFKALFLVVFKLNIIWLPIIVVQLLILDSSYLFAFYFASLQYIFALSIGMACAVIRKRGVGLIVLVGVAVINFIGYTPYSYEAYSHFFSISEQLYNINVINIMSVLKLSVITFYCISVFVISLNINGKRKRSKFILSFLCSVAVLLVTVYVFFTEYNTNQNLPYHTYIYNDNTIEYKAIDKHDAESISAIIFSIENEYNDLIMVEKNIDTYRLNKRYLPKYLWRLVGNEKAIKISADMIELNVVSLSMLNFNNIDMLSNFVKDVEESVKLNVDGYFQSRYTRHVIDGYEIVILVNAAKNLKIENSSDLYTHFSLELKEVYDSPITNYNYIKRLSSLIYDKHPELATTFYNTVLKSNPNSDLEFISLLENNFFELKKDKDISEIIFRILGDER